MKFVFLKNLKKNSIFSDFTHPEVSKIPISWGDASEPNASETVVGTYGLGPFASDCGISALEALFWKSNFHYSSHFSYFKQFSLENCSLELQKSKKFKFPETSFKAVLRAPKRSQHLPWLLRLSLGTPRTPMGQMKDAKILLEN